MSNMKLCRKDYFSFRTYQKDKLVFKIAWDLLFKYPGFLLIASVGAFSNKHKQQIMRKWLGYSALSRT